MINNEVISSRKNRTLAMSNAFTVAKRNHVLSLDSQKMEAWLISQINPTDEGFKVYRIEADQIRDVLGGSKNYAYEKMAIVCSELTNYGVKIKDGDTDIYYALVSKAVHHAKEGWCEMSIHPELKPHLLQLKKSGHFTQMELLVVLMFKKHYSYGLYKILKSRLHRGKTRFAFELELIVLKEILGCAGKYENFFDFNKKVLMPTQKEFQDKADIVFSYSPERKVRKKVISISITVTRKKKLPEYLVPLNNETRIDENDFDISMYTKDLNAKAGLN